MHRFMPFSAVKTPQFVPYQSYVEITGKNREVNEGTIRELLSQSYQSFHQAKTVLESEQLNENEETSSLLAVTKNNMVVSSILDNCFRNKTTKVVKFDFSAHKVFPMVKFA